MLTVEISKTFSYRILNGHCSWKVLQKASSVRIEMIF